MKQFIIIALLLLAKFSFAQTAIPKNIQNTFAGVWEMKEKHSTNTVSIRFEPGKNYAIVKDIGNGMAPPRILHATLEGKRFVIPAQREQNAYIELEVIKGMLHLWLKPANWDKNGNRITNGDQKFRESVFKRAEKW